MIKKLQSNEYLRRYDNMTAVERQEYLSRVGEWLDSGARMLTGKATAFEASLQNVLQVSVGWNDQECHVFEEGARLLSAMAPTADTWLPEMLYVKSAKRSIKRMYEVLWEVEAGEVTTEPRNDGTMGQRSNGATETPQKREPGRPRKDEQSGAETKAPLDTTTSRHDDISTKKGVLTPARPQHIDQYVHLLPKKTQERAALVKGLLQQMDMARENARLLMNDEKSSPADRARWASLATKCDKEVRAIYKELDEEWGKLVKSGRVVVDDLGNARVMPIDNGKLKIENGETPESDPQVAPQEKAGDPREGPDEKQETPKDANRRRLLRKWLVDTRRGNGDTREEHVKKWKETFAEYLAIEGEAAFNDEKIKVAAEHYGIKMGDL